MKLTLLILILPICAFGQINVCEMLTDQSGGTNVRVLAGLNSLEQLSNSIAREFKLNNDKFARLIIEIPPGTYDGQKALVINQDLIGKTGICLTGKGRPVLSRKSFTDKNDDATAVVEIEGVSNVVVKGFEIRGILSSANWGFSPAGISVRNFNSPNVSNVHIENNLINKIGHDYEFTNLSGYWRYLSDGGDYSNCRKPKPSKTEIRISCGQAHGITVNSTTSEHPIRMVFVERNWLTELRLGESEAISINNNVEGFDVRDNEIWDVDNIAIDITGKHDSQFQATNGAVSGNRVRGLKGAAELKGQNWSYPFIAGIYVDGATGKNEAEIKISDNTVREFGIGISVGSENDYCDDTHKCEHVTTEFVTVEGNVVENNLLYGIGIGKDVDEQNSRVRNIKVISNRIVGNVRSTNEAHKEYGQIQFGSMEKDSLKDIEIRSNLISASNGRLLVGVGGSTKKYLIPKVTFNKNQFFAEGGSGDIWSWGETEKDLRVYKKSSLVTPGNESMKLPEKAEGANNIWKPF